MEPGKAAWKKIKKEFGDTVFYPTGELNREVLGEIIFDDINKRRVLNEITHPEIYKEMFWEAVKCFFQGKFQIKIQLYIQSSLFYLKQPYLYVLWRQ